MTEAEGTRQEPGAARALPAPTAIEFLLPAWGFHHIRTFLDFGLPSLLAPGNLPALSRTLPCSFVILTRREDVPILLQDPGCLRLGEFCKLDIQTIDELIIEGHHSVTLTLAYERAIRARGSAIRDTCFFFLVADFLISDGTLARVYDCIRAGANGVLGGSFQIVAEDASADLRPLVNSRQELALSPRRLMALALNHLHAVMLAKVVNVPLCHDPLANRLFWRADKQTLLGRFFLLHMIAIRPEITSFSISAPCDYSFVPELCPSGKVEVMSDSDDYLIIEMQPRQHETARIRPGPFDVAAFGYSLMEWTTAQHRANARHTVIFHGGEIPPATSKVAAQADAFMHELERHWLAPPKPHREQAYWTRAVGDWRAAGGGPAGSTQPGRRVHALPRLRTALFGRVPAVRPWHPRWPDFQRLRSLLQKQFRKGERLLVVGASPGFAAWMETTGWVVEVRELAFCAAGQTIAESSASSFAGALLLIDADNTDISISALLQIEKSVRHGAPLVVMVTNGPFDDMPRAVPADWWCDAGKLAMMGPRIEQCLPVYRTSLGAGLQKRLVNHLRVSYHHPTRQVLSAVFSLLLLPASAISNLLTARRRTLPVAGFWSSLMIVMRSGASAISEQDQSATAESPSVPADCRVQSFTQQHKQSLENIGDAR
jgi:hypothetical protein